MTGSLPTPGSPDSDEGIAGAVTGEWVEVYPPDDAPPESEAESTPPRPAKLPSALFTVSLVLLLFGLVLPLFTTSMGTPPQGAPSNAISVTAWQLTITSASGDARTMVTNTAPTPLPIGYPIVLAILLALAAVVLRLRAIRAANVVGVVAASFLAALVFALGMFEIGWQNLLGSGVEGAVPGVGQGFWALLLAAVVGVTAAALSFRTPKQDEPVPNAWPDEPDEPEQEVPSGQPAEWPVVAVIPADERTNW